MRRAMKSVVAWCAVLGAGAWAGAQEHVPSKVDLAFNRYSDTEQTYAHLRALEQAYPDLLHLDVIGKSEQGRELLVATLTSPKHGAHSAKPAMWIDGAIHANEIQATEVVMYTIWTLTKGYGVVDRITELLDEHTFYLMPVVNPDSRQSWFTKPHTPNSARQNIRPYDNDHDGKIDEDPTDDLDGDGMITRMWKADPNGRWVRSQTDDRVFVRLRDEQTPAPGVATWSSLGEEGIDNDGDGRINEDGPFADDMNRNWPSDWQPDFVQGGAGAYPLSAESPRAIAAFVLARPNIGAGQAYHNAGGMILRGPGEASRENLYPREDLAVYDELARTGEQLLPYYRYLVIHKDLYRVHGGFVNWLAEGLGVFAFTNEMWTAGKYFQRDNTNPSDEQMTLWRDRMVFGENFSPYKEFQHPKFGAILIGGLNKWSSRNTPTFMLEEECHRNFAFTMYHAEQLPRLNFERVEVVGRGARLWEVSAEVRNTRLIPTRSALQQRERIGEPDLLEADGAGVKVVAAAKMSSWFDPSPDGVRSEPGRLLFPEGVAGRSGRIVRLLVEADEGASITLRFTSQRAREASVKVALRGTEKAASGAPGSAR